MCMLFQVHVYVPNSRPKRELVLNPRDEELRQRLLEEEYAYDDETSEHKLTRATGQTSKPAETTVVSITPGKLVTLKELATQREDASTTRTTEAPPNITVTQGQSGKNYKRIEVSNFLKNQQLKQGSSRQHQLSQRRNSHRQ